MKNKCYVICICMVVLVRYFVLTLFKSKGSGIQAMEILDSLVISAIGIVLLMEFSLLFPFIMSVCLGKISPSDEIYAKKLLTKSLGGL